MNMQSIPTQSVVNFIPKSQEQKNNVRASEQEVLSPFNQNQLQDSATTQVNEQVDQVKSNYKDAWNMDLMKVYAEQQQKVIDSYQNASDSSESSSSDQYNIADSESSMQSLTDMYATMFAQQQKINDISQPKPAPADDVVTTQSTQPTVAQQLPKKLEAYNQMVKPQATSFYHQAV